MTAKPTIHWLTQHLSDVPETNEWLSTSEQDTLDKLKIPKRQMDWRLGRWTAKRLLASHFQTNHDLEDFSRIEIRAASDGAPEVFFKTQPARVSISISHSNGCGFCACSPPKLALGCDVEAVEKRGEAFIEDYLTAEEQDWVFSNPLENHPLLATLLWSAKESTMKALRQGLRLDTRSVEIHLNESSDNGLSPFTAVFKKKKQTFTGWWRVYDKFVLTVVTEHATDISEASSARVALADLPHCES